MSSCSQICMIYRQRHDFRYHPVPGMIREVGYSDLRTSWFESKESAQNLTKE